jgi:heptosyltransferase-2
VLLCTPIFESLKSSGHEIAAVFRPEVEPLVRNNPHIDHLIFYDKRKGLWSFFKTLYRLRKIECDVSLSVQRYLKSVLLPVYAGIPKRVGFDTAEVQFLYTDEILYDRKKHEVERCLALCEGFSPVTGFSPQIFFAKDDLDNARQFLDEHSIDSDNFIVLAPGSIWATKRWGGYQDLVYLIREKYGCEIVLLGSVNDGEICREIASGGMAFDLAGKTDLLQSSAIIKQAKLAVTNDSAPAHIAAAVGTPVVTVFGPTVPAFGFTPYTDKSAIVENEELYCRPCSKHGPAVCPERHFRCMNEIEPERVLRACERLMI